MMLLQTDQRVIGGILRHGFHCVTETYSDIFIYKSEQYWRVQCAMGDFEIVRFHPNHPKDVMTEILSDSLYDKLQEVCQTIRLIVDPFDEMKEITDAPDLAIEKQTDSSVG